MSIPNHFICPISHNIMEDPVIIQDGFTYDREYIIQWFETNTTSPLTREIIDPQIIIPNINLKHSITEWKSLNDSSLNDNSLNDNLLNDNSNDNLLNDNSNNDSSNNNSFNESNIFLSTSVNEYIRNKLIYHARKENKYNSNIEFG